MFYEFKDNIKLVFEIICLTILVSISIIVVIIVLVGIGCIISNAISRNRGETESRYREYVVKEIGTCGVSGNRSYFESKCRIKITDGSNDFIINRKNALLGEKISCFRFSDHGTFRCKE